MPVVCYFDTYTNSISFVANVDAATVDTVTVTDTTGTDAGKVTVITRSPVDTERTAVAPSMSLHTDAVSTSYEATDTVQTTEADGATVAPSEGWSDAPLSGAPTVTSASDGLEKVVTTTSVQTDYSTDEYKIAASSSSAQTDAPLSGAPTVTAASDGLEKVVTTTSVQTDYSTDEYEIAASSSSAKTDAPLSGAPTVTSASDGLEKVVTTTSVQTDYSTDEYEIAASSSSAQTDAPLFGSPTVTSASVLFDTSVSKMVKGTSSPTSALRTPARSVAIETEAATHRNTIATPLGTKAFMCPAECTEYVRRYAGETEARVNASCIAITVTLNGKIHQYAEKVLTEIDILVLSQQ